MANMCNICMRKFCTKTEINAHRNFACKPPTFDQNYSMAKLIANSIKVELNEPISENSNRKITKSSVNKKISEERVKQLNALGSIEIETNELGQTVHKCPVCKKCFRKRWNLMEHLQRHLNVRSRPFQCSLCSKT